MLRSELKWVRSRMKLFWKVGMWGKWSYGGVKIGEVISFNENYRIILPYRLPVLLNATIWYSYGSYYLTRTMICWVNGPVPFTR